MSIEFDREAKERELQSIIEPVVKGVVRQRLDEDWNVDLFTSPIVRLLKEARSTYRNWMEGTKDGTIPFQDLMDYSRSWENRINGLADTKYDPGNEWTFGILAKYYLLQEVGLMSPLGLPIGIEVDEDDLRLSGLVDNGYPQAMAMLMTRPTYRTDLERVTRHVPDIKKAIEASPKVLDYLRGKDELS